MAYVRLYLKPIVGDPVMVDVPDDELVLTEYGRAYVPVAKAQSVTLGLAASQGTWTPFEPDAGPSVMEFLPSQEAIVCTSEIVPVQQYPDTGLTTVIDPTGGQCVCMVTCQGTNLSYVKVTPVT